ncbi:hypothetical protein K7B10_04435 [Streptomyces flavotricini]|uniref:Uncharacterized protein n=1 Tax=Streptomyces flavotricini TaxID=66888 RepID=A0ABS8DZ94_9ACTN|nr:hypothetical protein [Streptomyces flavotricini]MCC0094048.1 hypothetical protein [Streptomyces flavotricini]
MLTLHGHSCSHHENTRPVVVESGMFQTEPAPAGVVPSEPGGLLDVLGVTAVPGPGSMGEASGPRDVREAVPGAGL